MSLGLNEDNEERRNKQTAEMMRQRPCCVIDFLFVSSQLADRELKHAGVDIKTIVKDHKKTKTAYFY